MKLSERTRRSANALSTQSTARWRLLANPHRHGALFNSWRNRNVHNLCTGRIFSITEARNGSSGNTSDIEHLRQNLCIKSRSRAVLANDEGTNHHRGLRRLARQQDGQLPVETSISAFAASLSEANVCCLNQREQEQHRGVPHADKMKNRQTARAPVASCCPNKRRELAKRTRHGRRTAPRRASRRQDEESPDSTSPVASTCPHERRELAKRTSASPPRKVSPARFGTGTVNGKNMQAVSRRSNQVSTCHDNRSQQKNQDQAYLESHRRSCPSDPNTNSTRGCVAASEQTPPGHQFAVVSPPVVASVTRMATYCRQRQRERLPVKRTQTTTSRL